VLLPSFMTILYRLRGRESFSSIVHLAGRWADASPYRCLKNCGIVAQVWDLKLLQLAISRLNFCQGFNNLANADLHWRI
jgi:hypothetical protein